MQRGDMQPLEAMQAQLQAMAACVREEQAAPTLLTLTPNPNASHPNAPTPNPNSSSTQAARLAAEQGNERAQQQVMALVAQLNGICPVPPLDLPYVSAGARSRRTAQRCAAASRAGGLQP